MIFATPEDHRMILFEKHYPNENYLYKRNSIELSVPKVEISKIPKTIRVPACICREGFFNFLPQDTRSRKRKHTV